MAVAWRRSGTGGANAQKPVESRKPCGKKVTGRIPQRGNCI
jgi:hypothetical protein